MARKLSRPAAVAFLAVCAAVTLFPMGWMYYTSFSTSESIHRIPPVLFPRDFTFENYGALLSHSAMPLWLVNSLAVATVITMAQLLFNSMAGFALGRKRFVGRTTIFWVIVATMMVPAQVIVVPLYLMMARFHLIDSLFALIVPALAGPYGIFLMKQYLEGLPSDLEDAARIDGCSEWGVYRQVILPLSKPVLGVLAIFVFISNWNAFLWPLIVLNSPQRYTLTVGLATLQDKHLLDYGLLMAGASVAATPLIAVFLVFQKFAVKGITVGALKG